MLTGTTSPSVRSTRPNPSIEPAVKRSRISAAGPSAGMLKGSNDFRSAAPSGRDSAPCAGPEGYNLVVDVMPNVGASQPWNPGPLAPVTGDLFFVHSEIRFVQSDAVATAKHHARHPPDAGVTGNVKQRPIDPVHGLPHL